ncbi:hypothetical protein AHF37_01796 [Paragonimus kellicotti]|nr:hypothetical protein AHF37_01796 [Paragonimus kellicotti]
MSLNSDFIPPLNRPGEYPFGQQFGRSDLNLAASTSVIDGLPDEQRTSPVRRTFLLVMLFDLLLCLHCGSFMSRTPPFEHFFCSPDFRHVPVPCDRGSLRRVCCSHTLVVRPVENCVRITASWTMRCLPQLCSTDYVELLSAPLGLGESLQRSTLFEFKVAVADFEYFDEAVTGMTCVFFVIKCFLFDFHQNNRNPSGLVYVIIVAALIFTWLETSFLIYRVIPKEKAAAQIAECLTIEDPNETRSLLGALRESRRVYSTYAPSIGGYYTPVVSGSLSILIITFCRPGILCSEGSMFAVDMNQATSKTSASREAAVDIAAMLNRASQLHSEVWYLYRLEAWGRDSGTSEQHSIRSADLPGYNSKVFRLETVLDASPKKVFHDLVFNITETSSWNTTIDYIECIQSLPSENIDIVHNVVRESLSGAISRRDFVLLRHWGEYDDCYYLGITSVEHPKCPPMKNCVRAQQPISALVLEAISGELNRCRAVWIMCFDLKQDCGSPFIVAVGLRNDVWTFGKQAKPTYEYNNVRGKDFVLLRHWGEYDDCYYLGITSVEHPKCPPMKNCVRAQQPISALVLEAISGELNRCRAVWIMCFDLKLYLPQRLIDRALGTELSSMLTGLQQRARILQDAPQSDEQLLQTVTSQVSLVVPQPKWCIPMKRSRGRLSGNKRECTISEGDSSSDESGDKTHLLSVPR